MGLETAVAATWQAMVVEECMPVSDWIARWTSGPAALLHQDTGDDIMSFTVIDTQAGKSVDPNRFRTLSRNQPYSGRRFDAWPVMTVLDGKITWDGRYPN